MTTEFPSLSTTFVQNPKRRNQVSRACSNCRKTHAACDTERPCKRCIQHGLQNFCIDVPRKKRISKKTRLEQAEQHVLKEDLNQGQSQGLISLYSSHSSSPSPPSSSHNSFENIQNGNEIHFSLKILK